MRVLIHLEISCDLGLKIRIIGTIGTSHTFSKINVIDLDLLAPYQQYTEVCSNLTIQFQNKKILGKIQFEMARTLSWI